MINKIKLGLIIASVIAAIGGGWYVKNIYDKAKQRDAFAKENKTLADEKKVLADSLLIHKEWMAKALIDTKNSAELYQLSKGMTASFQQVIVVMRDSVIKINKDRVKLQAQNLELQKDLDAARKKRKLLF